LDDRIVVRPFESEEKTAGGIVLPDKAKEKQQRGKVVAVGPGKLLETGERAPLSVKVGDEVLFGKYSGNEVKVDGEELKIMRESDVLAKIEK
jgi:chaperonin GroES